MRSLLEPITQNRVVTISTHGSLCCRSVIDDLTEVIRDSGLLLLHRCADAFSDHKLAMVVARVDGIHSSVQFTDDALSAVGRSCLNLVDFAIGHFNDTISEVLQTLVVSNHDHRDLLTHVQVNQNLHHDIGAPSVQVTSRLVKKQNFRLVGNRARNSNSLLLTA